MSVSPQQTETMHRYAGMELICTSVWDVLTTEQQRKSCLSLTLSAFFPADVEHSYT